MMQLKGAPNIVSIEDYTVLSGTGSRTIMIRMELLESMDHYMKRCGPLSREEVIRLGVDICSALDACEQKKIVHRDIKPGNIFYSGQVGFKLGDFGVSRTMSSINSGMSAGGAGTIQFMAPEVYSGQQFDNTADIYSLGVVLYTLMNNNKPPLYPKEQSGTDPASERIGMHEANMRRLRGEELPLPANTDDRLGSTICMACNPEPGLRFQTARGFQNALKNALNNSVPEHGSRKMINAAAAAVICLFCLAVFLISGITGSKSVSYTILYEDESGNILDRITGSGKPGSKISVEGDPIDGYTLLSEQTGIVLSTQEAKNVIIVKYRKNASPPEQTDSSGIVSYTVLSTDSDGTTLARQEKEGAVGEKITENPPQIDGYTAKNEEMSITLSEDETQNILNFVYESDSDSMNIPPDNTLYYNGHHYHICDEDGII